MLATTVRVAVDAYGPAVMQEELLKCLNSPAEVRETTVKLDAVGNQQQQLVKDLQ